MDTQQLQQILTELRFSAGLSDEDQQKLAGVSRAQDFGVLWARGSIPLVMLFSGP